MGYHKALKRLWEIAKRLEDEGNMELASELYEIHDELKFKAYIRDPPPHKPFENVPLEKVELIAKIVGAKGYDPRTPKTAIAIALARSGGRMKLNDLARAVGTYPSAIRRYVPENGKYVWREGDYAVMDEDILQLVINILDTKKR